MNLRGRTTFQHPGIQLAPLVDVLLLLLIFFLMTWNAARNENELDVKVPKASAAKEKNAPIGDVVVNVRADGNVVVVQLALQGTHDGPLQLPFGELPATGKKMDAPCCDVFELEDGKIKRFDCYPEGSIIFAQLGVLNNLGAALSH